MKKIIGYTLLLVPLLTGCKTSIMEFPEGGGIDPTSINMNLRLTIDPTIEPYSSTEAFTKAEDGQNHDVRWIIEVFENEISGTPIESRVISCDPASDGNHTITTSFTLNASKYQVVAWMDYVDDGSTDDKYYQVSSLSSIGILDTEDYIGDEEHKEAYVGQQEIDLTNYRNNRDETIEQTITLTRPMAKIEFITTDAAKWQEKLEANRVQSERFVTRADKVDISSLQVTVEYAGYFPSGFNAYTNTPNDAREGVSFGSTMTPLSEQEARFGSDYIFVNDSESAVTVNLTISDDQGNVLNEIKGISVPIVRGQLTTIRDAFLTQNFIPGIGIDPNFDGNIDYIIPD